MPTCSLDLPLLVGERLFPEQPKVCAQVSGDGGCGGWVAAGGKQKACRVSAGPHPVGDRTFAPLAPYSDILGREAEDSWGLTGGHVLST